MFLFHRVWGQGTNDKRPMTNNGDMQQETSNKQQETSNKQQETSDNGQGTSNKREERIKVRSSIFINFLERLNSRV